MTNLALDIFVWVFGLCVGSFLNVVIYRLPLGLSITSPRWSFCPSCRHTLSWFDNLPVLSWMLLRARCRHCGSSISTQYPLIEALTGLAFVLVYRLLFQDAARVGLSTPLFPADAPLLLAWFALVAALVACSAMDIVSYMIDTGVTNVAVIAGIVLCALWGNTAFVAPTTVGSWGAAAVAAFLVSVIMLWRTVWRAPEPAPEPESVAAPEESATPAAPKPSFAGVSAVLLFLVISVWALLDPTAPTNRPAQRLGPPVDATLETWLWHCGLAMPIGLLAIFVVMVASAGHPREADSDLHAAIEEEAPHARRLALGEVLWLAPSIVAGAAAHALLTHVPAAAAAWNSLVHVSPLAGAVFAIHGAMVGAAAGWIVRVFFTLVFGREAFGVGDIYILAAAGACAGWDIALLGFALSIGVALLSFVLGLALKRTSMIAFGPPLALGFLLALWLNRPAALLARRMYGDLAEVWGQQPVLLASLLLGSVVIALTLSRLARRALEGGDDPGPADAPRP
jgi:prepilin signal peptidase PulO-like enzyme (type II secretory pathway)